MKPTSASAGHHHTPEEMHNDDVAHEHSDINIPALIWSGVVLAAVVVVTAGLMLVLFNVLESQAKARDPKLSPLAMPATTMPPTTNASPFFGSAPDPKLMADEPSNLKGVRELEQQQLHGYGWVDEKGGVTRIPIDRGKDADVRARPASAARSVDGSAPWNTDAGEWRVIIGTQHYADARGGRRGPSNTTGCAGAGGDRA